MLANMAKWSAIFGFGGRDNEEERGGMIGLIVMAILAPIAAMIIQMAISRQRIAQPFIYINFIFLPLHIEPRYGVPLMPGIISLASIGIWKVVCGRWQAFAKTLSHQQESNT